MLCDVTNTDTKFYVSQLAGVIAACGRILRRLGLPIAIILHTG